MTTDATNATNATNATPSAPRPRRRHPAQTGRVAAAGFGLASMFGIVGALGYAHRPTNVEPPTVPSPAPSVENVSAAGSVTVPIAPTTTQGSSAADVPTALTAKVVVQPVATSPTPAAKTHGSR